MKLKDADVIREEIASLRVIVTGVRSGKGLLCELMTDYRKNILQVIDSAPTIDAVPVVRCGECKRCFVKETKRHKQPMWICMRDDLNVCVHPHHFCSYGMKRDE